MAIITDKEAPADVPSTVTPPPEPAASKPAQGALIEAAMVRFLGTSQMLDDVPAKGERRTYIVTAVCKKHIDELRDDEEDRLTCVMKIESCYERGKVPIVDEAQPSLFEDPNPEADETPGESGIDLSGVDRPGFSDAEGSD